jgi:hypothetical protein
MDQPLIVFISSVLDDDAFRNDEIVTDELREERNCVEKLIGSMPSLTTPWAFEKQPAVSQDAREYFVKWVRKCHIFILLLDETLSEGVRLEYETAVETRKPRLAFIKKGPKPSDVKEFIDAYHPKYKPFSSIDELRQQVLEAIHTQILTMIPPDWKADQIEAAEKERNERIKAICNNNTPLPFVPGAKIVVHLVPQDSLILNTKYGMDKLADAAKGILPILQGADKREPTLEGYVSYSLWDNQISDSYVMLYSNGMLEAAAVLHISSNVIETPMCANAVVIPLYERALKNTLPKYLAALKALGVKVPIYLFLTLTGVKGTALWYQHLSVFRAKRISEDSVPIDPQTIERYDDQEYLLDVLRKCFDDVANAWGYLRSSTFSEA